MRLRAFLTACGPLPKVVVAEGAPVYKGPGMAVELAQAGIQTTLIPDCAVFAMMARVNKVPAEPCMGSPPLWTAVGCLQAPPTSQSFAFVRLPPPHGLHSNMSVCT